MHERGCGAEGQAATARPSARVSSVWWTLLATEGAVRRIERNSLTEHTKTVRSVAAVAVAFRRVPSSRAISPRISPLPRSDTTVAPASVSRVTRTPAASDDDELLRCLAFAH